MKTIERNSFVVPVHSGIIGFGERKRFKSVRPEPCEDAGSAESVAPVERNGIAIEPREIRAGVMRSMV